MRSTTQLSEHEYRQLWQRDRQSLESEFEDILYHCPAELGTGYDRWIDLPNISLLVA